jgi:large subunit ribosomal protein L25
MDKIVLNLTAREERGKQARRLRTDGRTPAVVYGHGKEAQAVSADARVMEKTYAQAGGNKIIGLKLDEARMQNALIHQVQRDPRTGHLTHADFYLVRMDEKIKTEIPLHFTGESTAVYQQEGTLVRPLDTIEVEALPADLPEKIEVDISILDDFEKSITVGDLKITGNVEVLTPAEELVARVEAPRSDEELEALDEEINESAEMPEGVQEEQEVIVEDQETRKEPTNKADGVHPG